MATMDLNQRVHHHPPQPDEDRNTPIIKKPRQTLAGFQKGFLQNIGRVHPPRNSRVEPQIDDAVQTLIVLRKGIRQSLVAKLLQLSNH